ncbi:hypothetical protein F1188_10280 [Roseospira marina]|uniref:Uncharacterized protein n=1 Tax=Roseospira marina TaxID=140057 RepID=A0A5M6IBJ2_9PROT|nr:hypothetical protein [Roseospira marina]KAA5605613.1 hypothetical protein F1188_10280 [Roseospira marina]MBB4313317.1 hypothetical protein [Roseospira marina]MBB5085942.1 hypothetical protein [Roseospira marina]
MFPFFPFGPVPPVPFLFPFKALSAWSDALASAGPFGPRAAAGDDAGAARSAFGAGFGAGPASLMSMAMMPVLAPFAMGSQMARVMEDAGQVAAQVRDSLERDDGPVHVVVGDPDGPLGLAIGLTFLRGGGRSHLADGTSRPEALVDVTPKPAEE